MSGLVSPISLLGELADGQYIVFKALYQVLIPFEFGKTEMNWVFECI